MRPEEKARQKRIGSVLRGAMRTRGVKIERVVQLWGVSQQMVHGRLSGEVTMSAVELEELAAMLRLSIDDVIEQADLLAEYDEQTGAESAKTFRMIA